MSRITDRKGEWFEIWFDDKKSILDTMTRNMVSDLAAGYDYFGASITRQQVEINFYKVNFDYEVEMLKNMKEKDADRWCYMDLKKRGAID